MIAAGVVAVAAVVAAGVVAAAAVAVVPTVVVVVEKATSKWSKVTLTRHVAPEDCLVFMTVHFCSAQFLLILKLMVRLSHRLGTLMIKGNLDTCVLRGKEPFQAGIVKKTF